MTKLRIPCMVVSAIALIVIATGCSTLGSSPAPSASNFDATLQPVDYGGHQFEIDISKWGSNVPASDGAMIVMTAANPNAQVYIDGGWSIDGVSPTFAAQSPVSDAINKALKQHNYALLSTNYTTMMGLPGPGKVLINVKSSVPLEAADWRMAIVDVKEEGHGEAYQVRWIKFISPTNIPPKPSAAVQRTNALLNTTLKLPTGETITATDPGHPVRWKNLSITLRVHNLPMHDPKYLEVVGNHSTVISHSTISTSAGPATLVLNERTPPAAAVGVQPTYEYWVIAYGSQYAYAIDAQVVGNITEAKNDVLQLVNSWTVPR